MLLKGPFLFERISPAAFKLLSEDFRNHVMTRIHRNNIAKYRVCISYGEKSASRGRLRGENKWNNTSFHQVIAP